VLSATLLAEADSAPKLIDAPVTSSSVCIEVVAVFGANASIKLAPPAATPEAFTAFRFTALALITLTYP